MNVDIRKNPVNLDELYVKDDTGHIAPILLNAYLALRFHPEWLNVLDMEENVDNHIEFIVKRKEPPLLGSSITGEWENIDNFLATIWLQHHGILVSTGIVKQAVWAVAATNCGNLPIKANDDMTRLI